VLDCRRRGVREREGRCHWAAGSYGHGQRHLLGVVHSWYLLGRHYLRTAPGITQAILDSGVVLTYGKLDGYTSVIWPTNQVALLPIVVTYIQGSTTYTDTWSAYATADSLRINFIDNQNLYNSISNAHQFRYVIIPGGMAGASVVAPAAGHMRYTRYTPDQLRTMPYETIARLFKIPRD
jgi:hypothetical protein